METWERGEEIPLEEVEYVGFHGRLMASVVDTFLSTLALLPLFSVFNKLTAGLFVSEDTMRNLLMGRPPSPEDVEAFYSLLWHLLFQNSVQLLVFGVIIVLFWVARDATPGKMFFRMRIVDSKTLGIPSRAQYIIRFFAYIVSVLPLAAGFFWILIDKKRQGFHDKIAGTVVIKTRKKIHAESQD